MDIIFKSTNETFNKFYNWFNQKNQYNQRIKYIRSVNGTEFNNKNFNKICIDFGIHHQFIVPYHQKQNGRKEIFNNTIITSAKTMLNDAKLRKSPILARCSSHIQLYS